MQERQNIEIYPNADSILSVGLEIAPEDLTPIDANRWVFINYVRGNKILAQTPIKDNGAPKDGELGELIRIAHLLSGFHPKNATEALEIIEQGQTVSLEAAVGDKKDVSLGDLAPDASEDVMAEVIEKSRNAELEEKLKILSEKEREILRLRHGMTGDHIEMTLEDIGNIYGVTRERVRQIEARALNKLRQAFRKHNSRDYFS